MVIPKPPVARINICPTARRNIWKFTVEGGFKDEDGKKDLQNPVGIDSGDGGVMGQRPVHGHGEDSVDYSEDHDNHSVGNGQFRLEEPHKHYKKWHTIITCTGTVPCIWLICET